jgi:hypothetical protein
MREVRALEKAAKDKMRTLDSEIAGVIVGGHIDEMEKKYDAQFKIVFDAIRELMAPPQPRRRAIGFQPPPPRKI